MKISKSHLSRVEICASSAWAPADDQREYLSRPSHHARDQQLHDAHHSLGNQPDLPPATRADASFELALATLHQALTATNPTTIEQHLRTALMRLTTLDREHENRLDACAYAAAIDAVLAFTDSTHHPGSIDVRGRVNAAADRLEAWRRGLSRWGSCSPWPPKPLATAPHGRGPDAGQSGDDDADRAGTGRPGQALSRPPPGLGCG
ncbi:hypothetical protein ACFYWY_25800 [Streptomyces sp. NPDC002870]|uniref:hypothetical protein n=1 Tax=Streptomyces sp. NPDC002870 TaxID=3364666 RepID=UPI0036C55736